LKNRIQLQFNKELIQPSFIIALICAWVRTEEKKINQTAERKEKDPKLARFWMTFVFRFMLFENSKARKTVSYIRSARNVEKEVICSIQRKLCSRTEHFRQLKIKHDFPLNINQCMLHFKSFIDRQTTRKFFVSLLTT